MKWFKHYSGSLGSESLSKLIRDEGLKGYARYWILLEHLAGLFDGETVLFRVPIETIRGLFRVRSWTELQTVVDRLSTIRGLDIKRIENVFEINAPILLELQGRDFKKARQSSESTAPKIKNKIKDKDIYISEQKKKKSSENFSEILNSTQAWDINLKNESEFNQIDDILKSPNVFGDRLPPEVSRAKQKFFATLVHVYAGNIQDFKDHLTSIINEELAEEKTGVTRNEYILTRIKKKALELHNAT